MNDCLYNSYIRGLLLHLTELQHIYYCKKKTKTKYFIVNCNLNHTFTLTFDLQQICNFNKDSSYFGYSGIDVVTVMMGCDVCGMDGLHYHRSQLVLTKMHLVNNRQRDSL